MSQNSIKKHHFLVVLDHFFHKNGPIDLFSGFFLSLDIRLYITPTCRPLSTFLGPFRGAQMPQNRTEKKHFLLLF
jgi:hypothetical protein